MLRCLRSVISVLVLLSTVVPAAPAHASDCDSRSAAQRPAPREPRIRTTDPRLRALIDDAVRLSPSLRALIDRLERSDVVVYVQCEGHARTAIAGRLTFVASAGGLRYVMVRLARLESRAQQIALLAHELQHAAEIADTPAIVDGPSLAREYSRIGHVNASSTLPGVAFDTTAAVEMGRRVLGELIAAAGD